VKLVAGKVYIKKLNISILDHIYLTDRLIYSNIFLRICVADVWTNKTTTEPKKNRRWHPKKVLSSLFLRICGLRTTYNKTLGRWTDVDGDHGMREAHSVWVQQHHALLTAGLVASSLKQRSHTNIDNNSIKREIKIPRV
jgi:hypothetical protein